MRNSLITLRSDVCSASFDPNRGGKVTSFRYEPLDFELLFQPKSLTPPPKAGMSFSDGDAAGFDDVFPSMGEAPLTINRRLTPLPDHGEIWTTPMHVTLWDDVAIFEAMGSVLPYRYIKTALLEGDTLSLRWRIENLSDAPIPAVWVCHALFRYAPNVRLRFPNGARKCLRVYPNPAEAVDWSDALLPEPGGAMKLYFAKPVREGLCEAVYPSARVKARMTWDADTLPWLGFWITTGGYRGDQNFAFEPATSYYDTIRRARKNRALKEIDPADCLDFRMKLTLAKEGD